MIYGEYIDHTMIFNNELYGMTSFNASITDAIVIKTCHRYEVYNTSSVSSFVYNNTLSRSIRNNDALIRLYRLAMGLESIIIGERYIIDQMNICNKDWYRIIIDNALKIRNKYNFWANNDYIQIALNMMPNQNIHVIGSGMLAKRIAVLSSCTIHTRNRKQAKKSFKKLSLCPPIMSLDKIDDDYCTIICTDTSDQNYRDMIYQFISSSNNKFTVDLSSEHRFNLPNYISIYDDLFTNFIDNDIMNDKQKIVYDDLFSNYIKSHPYFI